MWNQLIVPVSSSDLDDVSFGLSCIRGFRGELRVRGVSQVLTLSVNSVPLPEHRLVFSLDLWGKDLTSLRGPSKTKKFRG